MVLGCVVYRAARLATPGVVVEGGVPGSFVFGELGGGTSPRAERLLATLTAAGLAATVAPAIRVTTWEKFVGYTGGAAVSTLIRLPPDRIWACVESRELARLAMEETAAVGRAAGVPLPEDTVTRLGALYARMTPGTYPSLYYDLIAGKRHHREALDGTIVRLGRELGVPMPIWFTSYAARKPYAAGEQRPSA